RKFKPLKNIPGCYPVTMSALWTRRHKVSQENAMSIQWRDRFIDLLSAPYSFLGIKREEPTLSGRSGPQVPEKPYQNPGKDKNHPGDEAAIQSSTEPPAGAQIKH